MMNAVIWLIYANAPLDERSLYTACKYGYTLIAKILMASGADKNAALELARKNEDHETEKLVTSCTLDVDMISALLQWQDSELFKEI